MYSIIGFALTGGTRFVYTVLVGRVLGASLLASVSAALAMTVLFSMLWPAGLAAAAAQHVSTRRSLGQTFHRVLRVVEWSFVGSILIIMIVTGVYSGVTFHEGVVFVLSVVVLAASYSGYILARSLQLAIGHTRSAVLWEAVCAFIALAGLALVMLTGSSSAVLWPMAFAFFVYMVQAQIALRRHSQLGEHHDEAVVGELSRASAWNSASLLASNGLIQIAMLIVFAMVSRGEAGLFAAAISLATPASMLAQALNQVLLPRSSAWRVSEPDQGRRWYRQIYWALAACFVVVFGTLFLLTPWILAVLYGEEFTGAVIPLQVLLLGMIAFSIGIIATANLLAAKQESTVTVISIASLVVGLAVILALAGVLGWTLAASSGVTTGYLLGGLLLSVQSFRVFRTHSK